MKILYSDSDLVHSTSHVRGSSNSSSVMTLASVPQRRMNYVLVHVDACADALSALRRGARMFAGRPVGNHIRVRLRAHAWLHVCVFICGYMYPRVQSRWMDGWMDC